MKILTLSIMFYVATMLTSTLSAGEGSTSIDESGSVKFYLYKNNDCKRDESGTREDVDIVECGNDCQMKKGDRPNETFRNSYGSKFKNDDYRSLFIDQAKASCEITIYDEGDCDHDDDVTKIKVTGDTSSQCVSTFERNLSGRGWSSTSGLGNKDNGLDGKVSCIKISCF